MTEDEFIYLELFAGYGGFRYAFEKAGWKFSKVYFSEIDKYAIANYRYNYPDAEWLGSVTDIPDIGKVDLVTFGWPCQDNSIAGKRKGQTGDTRSGLLFHAITCVERFKPRNFVAENVEGLRTVNKGIDIIESLKVLAFLNDSMPQYDIEMQLLNTLDLGIPQNRKRLFFIGHLRNGSGQKIFPICENKKRPDSAVFRTISRGRKKNSVGCIDTRGGTAMDRSDLDKLIYDYKNNTVRRMTVIENERLQGLPDNFTKFGIFSEEIKEISDTQRYKLAGNGVSIPPIQAIAEKLLKLTLDSKTN
jgi:DNA (cytosine-5)-methyltransferase 1